MKEYNNKIGIDFGTTKTLVSYFDTKRNIPQLIRLGNGRDEIPTAIYIDGENVLIGEDAESYVNEAPKNFRSGRSFKLKLGSIDSILNGKTARDLTSLYLAQIKKRCEELVFHEDIKSVVITVPVNFSPEQEEDLISAARDANFEEVELLKEPISAGRAYINESAACDVPDNILILDWGGGTVDVSLLYKKYGAYKCDLKYTWGSNSKGGDFIDQSIFDAKVKDSLHEDINNRFRRQVRAAKEKLSTKFFDTFSFTQDSKIVRIEISQNDINILISRDVNEVAGKILELVNKMPNDKKPTQVILIGGTCKIPFVKTEIEKITKLQCRDWDKSREAVAIGAVIEKEYKNNQKKDVDAHIGEFNDEGGNAISYKEKCDEFIKNKLRFFDLSNKMGLIIWKKFFNKYARIARANSLIIENVSKLEKDFRDEYINNIFAALNGNIDYNDFVVKQIIEGKFPYEYLSSPVSNTENAFSFILDHKINADIGINEKVRNIMKLLELRYDDIRNNAEEIRGKIIAESKQKTAVGIVFGFAIIGLLVALLAESFLPLFVFLITGGIIAAFLFLCDNFCDNKKENVKRYNGKTVKIFCSAVRKYCEEASNLLSVVTSDSYEDSIRSCTNEVRGRYALFLQEICDKIGDVEKINQIYKNFCERHDLLYSRNHRAVAMCIKSFHANVPFQEFITYIICLQKEGWAIDANGDFCKEIYSRIIEKLPKSRSFIIYETVSFVAKTEAAFYDKNMIVGYALIIDFEDKIAEYYDEHNSKLGLGKADFLKE